MSTILKALQKVEGQRQMPPLAGPSNDYQSFEKSLGGVGRKRRWISFLLLLATCLVVGSGIWYLTGSSLIQSRDVEEISSGRGQVEQAPEPLTTVGTKIEEPPPFTQSAIAEVKSPQPGGVATPVTSSVAAKPRAETRGAIALLTPASKEKQSSPPAVEKRSVPSSKSVPPRIIVSGIAYQEDRVVRFAIINDSPLGEGEAIEGAVVEEIMEDRVRFKMAGAVFEVLLGAP